MCVELRKLSTANTRIIWHRCKEQWWQESATRKIELLPAISVPETLRPPQIPNGLSRDRTLGLHYDRLPTNRVIHGTDL
jgi:hypothetical protein